MRLNNLPNWVFIRTYLINYGCRVWIYCSVLTGKIVKIKQFKGGINQLEKQLGQENHL